MKFVLSLVENNIVISYILLGVIEQASLTMNQPD